MRAEKVQLLNADGGLLGGRTELRGEHIGVGWVENGGFNVLPKNRLRVVHQVGIERVVVGDENGERVLAASSGSADALGKGCAGAGPAGHDDRVQPGNVDTQLQRGGAGQAQQLAVAEPAFEFAALFGGVSWPVRGDTVGEAGLNFVEVALGLLREDLHATTGARKDQRAGAR